MSRRSHARQQRKMYRQAEKQLQRHYDVLVGADALHDLHVRLTERRGVAKLVLVAVDTADWSVAQTYWADRDSAGHYHVLLSRPDDTSIIVEMLLPIGTSRLVLASDEHGRSTTEPRVLGQWIAAHIPPEAFPSSN